MIASILVCSCSAEPLRDGSNRLYLNSTTSLREPVQSLLERRFVTVVRQRYDFSCGSAALATLLTYHYADPQSEQSVFLGMWRDGDRVQIRNLGFSLLDMKRYLATRGITADGFQVTLEQVRNARVPGIALLDINGYKHFVTVKGVNSRTVLIGDPSLGVRQMQGREFERAWNGIYFILHTGVPKAGAAFNSAQDLALAPKGLWVRSIEPLSLQALALTRPLPGDL